MQPSPIDKLCFFSMCLNREPALGFFLPPNNVIALPWGCQPGEWSRSKACLLFLGSSWGTSQPAAEGLKGTGWGVPQPGAGSPKW